jgi:hypothetical protein
MNRKDYVLAVLSAGQGRRPFTPLQVQKLFFLLDMKIPERVSGPRFSFRPYHYGPFDPSVYREIDELASQGLAIVDEPPFGMRTFKLTPHGLSEGQRFFQTFDAQAQIYIRQIAEYVQNVSFNDLVSAIYKEFPGMKSNSIFWEPS